jgi:CSLREA domain-containing protein
MSTKKSVFRICSFLLALALTFSAMGVTPARADAALTVNTASDADSADSECSLREAIIAANNDADYNGCASSGYGADTITFDANYTITLGSQLPAVTTDITITGNGSANSIVQASACNPVTLPGGCTPAAYRVFEVGATGDLTLDSLTVRHGKTTSGGGIYNSGTLTVTNSTFSGNSAFYGGGIYNNIGTLTVTNSTFSGNFAIYGGGIYNNIDILAITNSTFSGNSATYGGGIHNRGTLTATSSTFSDNSANEGGGGGIDNYNGTLTITNSTFSDNSTKIGGGIYNYGVASVTNSTFSGNSAPTAGGGIFSMGSSSQLAVTNSTLSGNSSSAGAGIHVGGNILYLKNNILANNSSGADCNMVYTYLAAYYTNNLIEINTGCGTPAITADPGLGALADNGGPTMTFALLSGSPAIDAGDDATCAAAVGSPTYGAGGFDQRSVTRPQGATCDIGAFESKTYSLTIVSTHGTVANNPDQAIYREGDGVQLTATPDVGWSFANWTGDLTSSLNPASVTIHGNTSVTANYTQNEYTLTIVSANGTVVANPNQATYHEGDVVQLTATPDAGWSFVNWTGGLTGTDNTGFVTIHGNTSVTANYTQDAYTLYLPLILR